MSLIFLFVRAVKYLFSSIYSKGKRKRKERGKKREGKGKEKREEKGKEKKGKEKGNEKGRRREGEGERKGSEFSKKNIPLFYVLGILFIFSKIIKYLETHHSFNKKLLEVPLL